jgi:two-component system, OmpR family, sensor histidine kinase ArlS
MAGMTKKLLNKTVRLYLAFSAVVLLLTVPVFYGVLKALHLEEADEMLMLRLQEFREQTLPTFHTADIKVWNKWNQDVKILASEPHITLPNFGNAEYLDVVEKDMEPFRTIKAPVVIDGMPFVYFARSSLLQTDDLIGSILLVYGTAILLLLIGLALFTRTYSRKLWEPFYLQLARLESYQIDKTGPLFLPETNTEEFQRLNKAIEQLVTTNKAIFKSQQEFIENAAHELQTPLAVIQSKMDNLVQTETLTGTTAASLTAIYDTLERMNHINQNLLLLSRIGGNTFSDKAQARPDLILSEQADFLAEQAIANKVDVRYNIIEQTEVFANPYLLEVMIRNLLTNAIRYNRPGGVVRISLGNKALHISNTGKEEKLDELRIFERFAKASTSASGNGLGLAIVKQIVDRHGWTITYSYEKDKMHHFIVDFQ